MYGYLRFGLFFACTVAVVYKLLLQYWVWIPYVLKKLSNSPIELNRHVEWLSVPAKDNQVKPNIVLILADDLGFNDISFYGGGFFDGNITTPHIDSIGKKGVAFSSAYSGHATCAPSRAALLTGRYATRIGYEYTPVSKWTSWAMGSWVNHNKNLQGIYHDEIAKTVSFANASFPKSALNIAEALNSSYRSLFLGKWHSGLEEESQPINRGFDETLGFNIVSNYLPMNHPNSKNCYFKGVFDRIGWSTTEYEIRKDRENRMEPGGYLTDYLADEASKAIHANRNNPFFLYLSFSAVHIPLQALKSDYDALSHIDDHCARIYGSMIVALDRAVGKVLQALKENNIDDNTMVIFTSDNGAANYINLHDVNKPYRGWKATFFDGGIHVPMLIQWPKLIPPNITIDAIVSHIDIFPTIMNIAGTTISHLIDGIDLLPYILSASNTPVSEVVAGEEESSSATDTDTSDVNVVHKNLFWRSGHYMALRKGKYKIQKSGNPQKVWLFDVETDEGEQNNLVDNKEYGGILEELLSELELENATHRESLWPSLSETPIMIDKFGLQTFEEGVDEYVYWSN